MGGMSTDWGSSRDYSWSDDRSTRRKSAKDYAKQDKRTYTGYSSEGLKPPIGKEIKTDSVLAGILMLDLTGSMRKVPEIIIQKMPTIYAESNAALQGLEPGELSKGKKKLEDMLEMAVIGVGDVKCDSYPLQVVDFSKGADLVKGVNKIYPEGNGGGNARESYDLAAYYILNHCKTPKVPKGIQPLLIIVGDEGFYDTTMKSWVKQQVGDKLTSNLDTKKMMKKLASKYDTYILRPEESYRKETYRQIHRQWQEVLGDERVLKMKDLNRIVDNFIMVCGLYSDNYKNAMDMLERRQIDPDSPEDGLDKLESVLETIHPIIGKDVAEKEVDRLKKKYKK